jgi:hypothetical protein
MQDSYLREVLDGSLLQFNYFPEDEQLFEGRATFSKWKSWSCQALLNL